MIEIFGKTMLAILAISFILFFGSILGAGFGALAGFIVGWFFGDTILGIFGQLGLHDLAMWQIGAWLGFVGAFFKSTQTVERE